MLCLWLLSDFFLLCTHRRHVMTVYRMVQEAGVDCGSVCGVMCAVQPVPLLPLWTRTFPVSEGVYAAVAYVENQNETLYVPEVQYEIVLLRCYRIGGGA